LLSLESSGSKHRTNPWTGTTEFGDDQNPQVNPSIQLSRVLTPWETRRVRYAQFTSYEAMSSGIERSHDE
jgi:hypothetical protein